MTQSAYAKGLPEPTEVSQPFWSAAKNRELRIQRCTRCRQYVFYPREMCPYCLTLTLEWVKVTGRGKVYSWTVVRRPTEPRFEKKVPFVFAVVELEEGPHLATNIVNCKLEDISMGMPVQAVFDDITPEITLVKFEPCR